MAASLIVYVTGARSAVMLLSTGQGPGSVNGIGQENAVYPLFTKGL